MSEPLIVLTPGDPEGIGPEITWKAIQHLFKSNQHPPTPTLCVGAKKPFEQMGVPLLFFDPQRPWETSLQEASQIKEPFVWIYPAPEQAPQNAFLPGFQAGWAIQTATQLVLDQHAHALVTGPISKERLQRGGFSFPGHTEFLAHLCHTPTVTMMLANSTLRVTLVTTHEPLHQVSAQLTREKIRHTVTQTALGLQNYWKINHPRIAILALNPHAGESGLFGREEIEVIQPEIDFLKTLNSLDANVEGPFPADTFFAQHLDTPAQNRFDAVVCMYHDQGLIPVKLLDFHRTVNVTLGLPIIRTSVDHGVGFDIAGKGIANPSSLISAIELAIELAQKKN